MKSIHHVEQTIRSCIYSRKADTINRTGGKEATHNTFGKIELDFLIIIVLVTQVLEL